MMGLGEKGHCLLSGCSEAPFQSSAQGCEVRIWPEMWRSEAPSFENIFILLFCRKKAHGTALKSHMQKIVAAPSGLQYEKTQHKRKMEEEGGGNELSVTCVPSSFLSVALQMPEGLLMFACTLADIIER